MSKLKLFECRNCDKTFEKYQDTVEHEMLTGHKTYKNRKALGFKLPHRAVKFKDPWEGSWCRE